MAHCHRQAELGDLEKVVKVVKLYIEILGLGTGPSSQSVFFVINGDLYTTGLKERS